MVSQAFLCIELKQIIANQGWGGPFVFVFLSTVLLMCLVPRTLMMILAGICFGVALGGSLILIASMLSGFLSFTLGRYLGRAWVEKNFRKKYWFHRLESLNHTSGFYVVMIARLAHVVHFGASSYVFGVFDISLKDFMWGSFLGILPGTWVFIYATHSLGCGQWDRGWLSKDSIYHIVFLSIFVLFISVVPKIFQTIKNKKSDKED